jgi:hypothetical protein
MAFPVSILHTLPISDNQSILHFLAIIEMAASATGPLEELDTVEGINVDESPLQKLGTILLDIVRVKLTTADLVSQQ